MVFRHFKLQYCVFTLGEAWLPVFLTTVKMADRSSLLAKTFGFLFSSIQVRREAAGVRGWSSPNVPALN